MHFKHNSLTYMYKFTKISLPEIKLKMIIPLKKRNTKYIMYNLKHVNTCTNKFIMQNKLAV